MIKIIFLSSAAIAILWSFYYLLGIDMWLHNRKGKKLGWFMCDCGIYFNLKEETTDWICVTCGAEWKLIDGQWKDMHCVYHRCGYEQESVITTANENMTCKGCKCDIESGSECEKRLVRNGKVKYEHVFCSKCYDWRTRKCLDCNSCIDVKQIDGYISMCNEDRLKYGIGGGYNG